LRRERETKTTRGLASDSAREIDCVLLRKNARTDYRQTVVPSWMKVPVDDGGCICSSMKAKARVLNIKIL
jgi:hypothetical protein